MPNSDTFARLPIQLISLKAPSFTQIVSFPTSWCRIGLFPRLRNRIPYLRRASTCSFIGTHYADQPRKTAALRVVTELTTLRAIQQFPFILDDAPFELSWQRVET